jgi:phage I-like protein
MISAHQDRLSKSQYAKQHREAWAKLGYRPFTTVVHDSDRGYIRAMAQIVRFERLLEDVKGGDISAAEFALGRNIPKMRTYAEGLALRSEIDAATLSVVDRRHGIAALAKAKTATDQYNAARITAAQHPSDTTAIAEGICYGNIAAAYFEMASSVLEYTAAPAMPKPTLKNAG